MKTQKNLNDRFMLEKKAWQIRLELLRMFSHGKSHHFGGSLSCVELLTALYFYKMNYSLENMKDPGRDRFVMSKGHSVPTQYVILAMLGIIPTEELSTIKVFGSRLQGHPDIRKTPGIEAPTGSLGQGLSYANGIALAGKLDNYRFKVYVLVGDGELQEGQIWEAAMTTAHYNLSDFCVIVDRNRYQAQGEVEQMKRIEPLEQKWQSFGWQTESIDGHDIDQICGVLDIFGSKNDKPMAILANTVKGKGISFIENTHKYHNLFLTEKEYSQAEKEILMKIDVLNKQGGGIDG